MAQTHAVDTDTSTPASSDDGSDSQSWLSSLRSRLGFGDSPTLRGLLEDALRDESNQTDVSFSRQERDMLLRILRFGALRVDDVMVPRADIIAIDELAPIAELLRTFETAGHSRIPVYRETLDDLKGMIHIKDVVAWLADRSGLPPLPDPEGGGDSPGSVDVVSTPQASPAKAASSAGNGKLLTLYGGAKLDLQDIDLSQTVASAKVRRDVLFVPPSMPAVNLLLRMQSTRVHLAMVVDEYGGTDGLISIEDLVEEIVGTIEDEHDDQTETLVHHDAATGLIAAARTPVDELEQHLGVTLLDEEDLEDIDTLGGLVFSLVGRVPVRGELIRHDSGIEFEVLDADPRRIKQLRIHRRGDNKSDLSPTAAAAVSTTGPALTEAVTPGSSTTTPASHSEAETAGPSRANGRPA